jgi:hypothetical protein
MISEREKRRSKRAKMSKRFGKVYDKLSALLFYHDPLELAYMDHPLVQDNPDEYDSVVDDILPKLAECWSEDECLNIIHNCFSRGFSADGVGPISKYNLIAHETWALWNEEKLN